MDSSVRASKQMPMSRQQHQPLQYRWRCAERALSFIADGASAAASAAQATLRREPSAAALRYSSPQSSSCRAASAGPVVIDAARFAGRWASICSAVSLGRLALPAHLTFPRNNSTPGDKAPSSAYFSRACFDLVIRASRHFIVLPIKMATPVSPR